MRRIMMFNRVSADGYFTKPDGNLDWFVPEPEIDEQGGESASQVDTYLFGRKTYEMMSQFWPHALDPGTKDPHGGGEISPQMRAMAKSLNESTKLVFSRTLKEATWKNTRIIRDLDPREIASMKNQDGRGMIILGSGEIVSQLTEHGLIDDYQIVLVPVFLGDGKPLIHGLSKNAKVKLVEAKPHQNGSVSLSYSPATPSS